MREIGWTLREAAVREIARQGRTLGRALIGTEVQNAMLVGGFLVLAQLTGLGGVGLRGDLLAYLLAGVFLFNLHAKAMSAAMSSADVLSAGRLYRTDPLIQATGGSIGAAYLQLVSAAGLILAYHALVSSIEAAMTAPLPLLAASWISGLGSRDRAGAPADQGARARARLDGGDGLDAGGHGHLGRDVRRQRPARRLPRMGHLEPDLPCGRPSPRAGLRQLRGAPQRGLARLRLRRPRHPGRAGRQPGEARVRNRSVTAKTDGNGVCYGFFLTISWP